MKRGLRIHTHDPLPDGQDPYVDVVVAMPRRNAEGLWIPNMNAGDWNASHPQKHVQLLVSGSRALRRVRAQVIRVVKVWNNQYTNPALNSFNVCALGLESITEPAPIQDALLTFFEHAVDSLKIRRTEDPAGVSGPIKLEQPKDITLQRLTLARGHLRAALDADDDRDAVQAEMHEVFWKSVPAPVTLDSKAAVAAALRTGTPRLRATPGMGVTSMPMVAGTVKPKRAFGGRLG